MHARKVHAVPVAAVSFLVMTLVWTLTAGATSQSLDAERPKDEAFRTVLKREPSTMNVTMEASSEEIARILNQTIGRELYKGSTRTKGLTADVLRNGPIAVSAADNSLYLTLPIIMSLSYAMFETPAIPLKLKFRARAGVTPDWKLNTDIQYMGLSDLLAEETGIGPLSIKPRSIIEGITQPVQKVLSDLVNKKINEMFPLRARVAPVWNAAHKPVLVDRSHNAWLKLTPRELMLHPLYAQNNRVRLSVGISSFAELVVGPEPAAQPPLPLPNLKLVNNLDRGFRIALNADLYYKELLNSASSLLLNKEFTADGRTIVIKGLDLYGNGDKVVVKLDTQGSVEGTFYLTGKPMFDPLTNRFSVTDVDFDLSTQSLLLKSANWFLHGTIKGMIQEKLNMDLTHRLEQSRAMAQKAIAQVKLADHLLLKGTVKKLSLGDVLVQKDKICIQVYSEGETTLALQ